MPQTAPDRYRTVAGMHPTSARSARGPAQARTGNQRRRGILALLAALACLAVIATVVAELTTSPSGPVTSPTGTATPPTGTVTSGAGTAAPHKERLAEVSWPAYGVSAADISGFGVVAGPG